MLKTRVSVILLVVFVIHGIAITSAAPRPGLFDIIENTKNKIVNIITDPMQFFKNTMNEIQNVFENVLKTTEAIVSNTTQRISNTTAYILSGKPLQPTEIKNLINSTITSGKLMDKLQNPLSFDTLPLLMKIDELITKQVGYDPYIPLDILSPAIPLARDATMALKNATVSVEHAIEYINSTWQGALTEINKQVSKAISTINTNNATCSQALNKAISDFVAAAIGNIAQCITNEMNVYDNDLHLITNITTKADADLSKKQLTLNLALQIGAASQKISTDLAQFKTRPAACLSAYPVKTITDTIYIAINMAKCI